MEYTQLDFARFETRFLRLSERPKDITEPIRFEITIASLNSPPRYDALSYCWGDASQTSMIEVDGKRVEVSKNLAEALFNAGLEVGDHIWADAICIDQSNLYEKSYQIMRMGQIYSQSEQTVVWIGNEARYSKHAAKLLSDPRIRRSAESFLREKTATPSDPFTEDGATPDSSLASNEVAFRDVVKGHTYPARASQGLRELLSRPYWERAWIIQEIAKARYVTIKCGDFRLDLNSLLYVSHKAADISARTRSLLDAIVSFRTQEQRGPGAFNRMSLYEAIMQSRYSLAKDERDKVYALLGLTSDGSDLIPTPTYTESIDQIWLNLTKAIIQSRRQTNVLLLSRWAPLAYRFPKMPHWAVDWSDIAYKGMSSVNYNFLPICEVLWRLGRVVILQDPIWHWAKEYNSSRSSQGSTTTYANPFGRRGNTSEDAERPVSSRRREVGGRPSSTPPLLPPTPPPKRPSQRGTPLKSSRTVRERDGSAPPTGPGVERRGEMRVVKGLTSTSPPSIDVPPSPNPAMPPLAAFRYWELVLRTLDQYPEFPLRFAVMRRDDLIMACDGAGKKDEIYELEHCALPVLLRRKPMGDYMLVGEVCLGRSANGEWVLARKSDVDPFGIMFRPESPTRPYTASTKAKHGSEDWSNLTIELDSKGSR